MNLQRLLPLLSFPLLTACIVGEIADHPPSCTGGKCDASGGDQTCADPRYGDGVCNPQLTCGVPDIDCFHTFASDAEAATWFTDVEAKLAAEEGRAPRALLPETDPVFRRARDLLDRGWAAFRSHQPVGEQLATRRPALVLLADPTRNAFVMPDLDLKKSAFSIQVQTGFFDAKVDDSAFLGVMMHELQHAVGLHLIGTRRVELRKYYVADRSEPRGREQLDDARAHRAGLAWRTGADEVAFLDDVELGGFPLAGQLGRVLKLVTGLATQRAPAACARANGLADAIRADLHAGVDPIDLHAAIDLAPFQDRVAEALAALRDECLPEGPSYIDVLAELNSVTAADYAAQLSPHDRALVDGQHVIDGIAALTEDRRAAMRAAEAAFSQATGQPWSALRYFSIEEDADDTSVAVLRAAGRDPAGEAAYLPLLLPDDATRERCAALVDAGTVPPYGVDLTDDHHAMCWRIFHVTDEAAPAQPRPHAITPANASALDVAIPDPIRLPERVADHVAY